jgi:deoxyribodipyrimidine photo-lyase
MPETALVWLRRDLRLHDNEVFATDADRLCPVYCFDPREYGRREFGGEHSFRYPKTGPHRVRFRRESVRDLRARLRDRGSELVVRHARPEAAIPAIAATIDADEVRFQTLPTPEEETVEAAVREALPSSTTAESRWTHTLYHVDDLPGDVREIDDTFTPFRKTVEAGASVREPVAAPSLPPLPDAVTRDDPDAEAEVLGTDDDADADAGRGTDADRVAPGAIPSADDLGVEEWSPDERGVLPFEGGETAALDRVEEWIWDGDHLRRYKQTRNGLVGTDFSSKLSAWLAEGCLSPRYVHREVDRYERERVSNDDTYWLVFELTWRDFFQFQLAKHGATVFARGGIRHRTDVDWRTDEDDLRRWAAGETGIPFVDANMRELARTGYMSNRGRQNVASFLAKNLRLDWRLGAAYFETQLVDYDPASNYGNWAYVAGVGNDSRDSYFDVVKQARRYDDDATYVRRWCPELDPLPPRYAHEPWTMSPEEQADYGVELGVDYPRPMIDLETSYEKLR